MADPSLMGESLGGFGFDIAGFITKLALVVGGTLIIGIIAIFIFDRLTNRRDYRFPHFMIKEMGQGRPKGIVTHSAYDPIRRIYRTKDNVVTPDYAWENKIADDALLTYMRNIDDVMPVLFTRPPDGLLGRTLALIQSSRRQEVLALRTPQGFQPALYINKEDKTPGRVIVSIPPSGLQVLLDTQAIEQQAGRTFEVEEYSLIGLPVVTSEHYAVAYPQEAVRTRVVPDPSIKTVVWNLLKENANRFTVQDWIKEHGPMIAQMGGVLILLVAMILGFRYIGGDISYKVEIAVRQFVDSGGLEQIITPAPTPPPGPPPGFGVP